MYWDIKLKATAKKKARDAQLGGLTNLTKKSGANDCQEAGEEKHEGKKPVTLDKLEGCFDSLVTAAVTGKDSSETLMKANVTLIKTNTDLSALVKCQETKMKSLYSGRRLNKDKNRADEGK